VTAIGIFLAVFIAFYLIRLAYSRSALDKLSIDLSFSAPRATEGAQLVLTTVLTNEKWLPLPWVAVKLKVSRHLHFADMENSQITDQYYRNDLYNILMRQRITRRLGFTCSKRGYYSIPTVDLTAWDILMEEKSAQMVDCGATLTVYPAILSTPEIDNLSVQIYGQLRAKNIIHPDPFSFRGIREYTQGDPLKAINFKASAKAQELMVNQWEYINAREVILMYNLQRHSVWHNEVLDEYTIKVVASLAEKLAEENVPTRFITNGHLVDTRPVKAEKKLAREQHDKEQYTSYAARILGETKKTPSTSGDSLNNSSKSSTKNAINNSINDSTKTKDNHKTTEIPEGIGELHLERILETLALLDVEQTDVAPFSEILASTAETYKTEPEYWLVSTYHGADLEEAYKNLQSQGARTVWVLPHTVGLRTGADDISLSPELKENVILV